MSEEIKYSVLVISPEELTVEKKGEVVQSIRTNVDKEIAEYEYYYEQTSNDISVLDPIVNVLHSINLLILEGKVPFLYFVGDIFSSPLCITLMSMCKTYGIRGALDAEEQIAQYAKELKEAEDEDEN